MLTHSLVFLSTQDAATTAAKQHPRRVFEGDWVEWLPGSSRAPSDAGLLKVIEFVLDNAMIDPSPQARPQDVASTRRLLEEALSVYSGAEVEEKVES